MRGVYHPDRLKNVMVIDRPALVIYSFAPKRLPTSQSPREEAVQYFRNLWYACTRLGMTEPAAGLDLPTEFPADVRGEGTAFRLLAAKLDKERREAGADYQAYLFEYQDVFGLIATLESNAEDATPADWQALYDSWVREVRSVAPAGGRGETGETIQPVELPDGLLGETLLFHGLCDEELLQAGGEGEPRARLAQALGAIDVEVSASAPACDDPTELAANLYLAETGFCLMEGSGRGGRREIVLLSPKGRKEELFAWTAWAGPGQLAPFARYLMHACKVRFSQEVFERERHRLDEQRLLVDATLDRLLALQDRLKVNEFVSLDELEAVQHELDKARAGSFGVLYGLSRLKELGLTVQIAEQNTARLIPAHSPGLGAAEGSLFLQDAARAKWLREQLGFELTYLEAVHQRAEEGHRIIATRLEFESRKSERQLNRLILLQGTLLGSLLTGLAAIQSLEVKVGGDSTQKWSVVALVMALALALPPLFAHWHGRYRAGDFIAAGGLGASVAWLAATLCSPRLDPSLDYAEPSFSIPGWLLLHLLAAFAGFWGGYLCARRLERIKRRAL